MEPGKPNPKPEDFWEALEASPNLTPNFWMTEEYVQRKGLQWVEENGLWGWQEMEEGGWVFPPIDCSKQFIHAPCWAGFSVSSEVGAVVGAFSQVARPLDFQFIYDPERFLDLTGSQWKVFRKNIKKYPERFPGFLEYKEIKPGEHDTDLTEMLLNWAGAKDIYDNDVMVDYLFNGNMRWGLFRDGKLEGVNVADENHKHLIFRYCLDSGIPFLNEYLRWRFYTDPFVQACGKLVNDGGSLGSLGLFNFKMKLNPVEVQQVFITLPKEKS